MLKVYIGVFYEFGRWGSETIICTVVANTETEALGLLLQENIKTKGEDWSIEEVDMSSVGVEQVHYGFD